MTYDLQVPGDVLEETGRALGSVRGELENAGDNADECAEAVGERGLAEAVREFSGNWDSSRDEIVSAIGKLDEIAKACAQTFEKIEERFVSALDDAMSGSR